MIGRRTNGSRFTRNEQVQHIARGMLKGAGDQTAFAEDVRRTGFRRLQSRPFGDAQFFKLQPDLTTVVAFDRLNPRHRPSQPDSEPTAIGLGHQESMNLPSLRIELTKV